MTRHPKGRKENGETTDRKQANFDQFSAGSRAAPMITNQWATNRSHTATDCSFLLAGIKLATLVDHKTALFAIHLLVCCSHDVNKTFSATLVLQHLLSKQKKTKKSAHSFFHRFWLVPEATIG